MNSRATLTVTIDGKFTKDELDKIVKQLFYNGSVAPACLNGRIVEIETNIYTSVCVAK
jgi:hypothetical protein